MDRLAEQPVDDLLGAIGSTAPAPGAGAAAAIALALGLACARKAVAMTLKHQPAAGLEKLDRHLAGLIEQALAGGDADAACFTALIEAHGETEAHHSALEDIEAVDANLVAIGDEAHGLIDGVRQAIIPSMAGDISAALGLIAAARSVHAACVAEARRALGA